LQDSITSATISALETLMGTTTTSPARSRFRCIFACMAEFGRTRPDWNRILTLFFLPCLLT
jgi:hypothetical protein